MARFREILNTWGTIVFSVLMVVGGGHALYDHFTERDGSVQPQAVSPSQAPAVKQSTAPNVVEDNTLRQRCIGQAHTQGYRSGRCAYSFIDVCIRTQSRQEMEAALRTAALLGMGDALSCPNMPSTYVAEFDRF